MATVQSSGPLVLSSYDPSGQYLCYVTTALDKQRVSVEPTQKGQNDSTLNEKFLYLESSDLRVTSLKWAFLNSNETLCVFIGLNNGEIWLYSPLGNEIIIKLSTENGYDISDFVIAADSLFCIDSNDVIFEFDLVSFSLRHHYKIEECSNLKRIEYISENKIMVASHQLFLINNAKREVEMTLPGHISPVCTLKKLSDDYILSGAENDRFLNIYNLLDGTIKSVLVAKSNVNNVSTFGTSKISITTESGNVEVFVDPLIQNKNKRRNMKSRQSTSSINITTNDGKLIPCADVFSGKDTIDLTYLTNATMCNFVRIRWDSLELQHTITVNVAEKVRNQSKDRSLLGKDLAAATTYQEGNSRVTSGDNFKHLEDVIRELELQTSDDRADADEKSTEVESLADKLPMVQATKRKNPMAGTVGVILAQALQSNDHSLLETVLNNSDERVIRDTIIRLQPTLSVILLERLAERIARQSHRQGQLNVWVKWCIIIHGGYLITVPNLIKTLASLHSTLKNRAGLLERLLELETRLDCALNRFEDPVVDAFVNQHDDEEYTDYEDESVVTYVEELDDANLMESGEEGESSEEEEDFSETEINESQVSKNSDSKVKSRAIDDVSADEEEGYSDVEMA